MKLSISQMCIILFMHVNAAIAACRDNNNSDLDIGFLDCVKAGYNFSDSYDDEAFNDMSGGWATNCRDKSVRVHIVHSNRGIVVGQNILDDEPGAVWSIVSIKHIGITYYINYSDDRAKVYRAYVFTLLPGPTAQLVNMSQLKDGTITDNVVAGRNVSTKKALPQLRRCEP